MVNFIRTQYFYIAKEVYENQNCNRDREQKGASKGFIVAPKACDL